VQVSRLLAKSQPTLHPTAANRYTQFTPNYSKLCNKTNRYTDCPQLTYKIKQNWLIQSSIYKDWGHANECEYKLQHNSREGLEAGKEMRLSRLTRLALSPRNDWADFFWDRVAGDWPTDPTVSALTDVSGDAALSMLTNCCMPLKFHVSCLMTLSAAGSVTLHKHRYVQRHLCQNVTNDPEVLVERRVWLYEYTLLWNSKFLTSF